MYDSAARVQEIADLCVNDFRIEKPSTLRLTGKGQKTRIIPLMVLRYNLMFDCDFTFCLTFHFTYALTMLIIA